MFADISLENMKLKAHLQNLLVVINKRYATVKIY